MLRTKAMREREEQRERRKYNYTLLRIRLPDGNLLQGQRASSKSPLNMENPGRAEVEVICARVCFKAPFMRGIDCRCSLGSFGNR